MLEPFTFIIIVLNKIIFSAMFFFPKLACRTVPQLVFNKNNLILRFCSNYIKKMLKIHRKYLLKMGYTTKS